MPRKDASLSDGARVRHRRFRFKDGENDRVAFDEHFLRVVAIEKFLDGFVEIQAEVRGRVQAAREEVLRHARGAANVGLDDDVRNHVVLCGSGLL